MKKYKTLLVLSALVFTFNILLAQTPDPGVRGNFAVSTDSYDMGDQAWRPSGFSASIEIRATVHYPTDLSSGPFPVLVFLHGRHATCYLGSGSYLQWPCSGSLQEIPSYQGYEYLADFMASHGYIVISIGANGISGNDGSIGDRGMNARAQLIQYHLNLWNTFNTSGGSPFGSKFVGKVDLTRIGTMGHSRGGEGVIVHGEYNKTQNPSYGLKVVFSVAPTDYNRPKLNGVPVVSVLPYCDGDEPNLGGLHYYDDARYADNNDDAPKHTIVMMGGNHNYFNTVWTPGMFSAGTMDDWELVDSGNDDPVCGVNTGGNKRILSSTQRQFLIAYAAAVFRYYVGGEKQFAPILEGDDPEPPASSTMTKDQVWVSYHPGASKRLDINRLDTETTETGNTLGGNVSQNGLVNFDICGDDASEILCLQNQTEQQEPHNHSWVSGHLGLSQLLLQWDDVGDWFENQIPDTYKDFSSYVNLQFRAAVDFTKTTSSQNLDFSVELKDGTGATHSEKVSDHSHAVWYADGNTYEVLPRVLHNMVRIPLSSFSGVDLTNISAIRFNFDQASSGAIFISDLNVSVPIDHIITSINGSSALSSSIKVYPNPSNNIIRILGTQQSAPYEIYNALGRKVMQGNQQEIDVSMYPAGVYLIKSGLKWGRFVVE